MAGFLGLCSAVKGRKNTWPISAPPAVIDAGFLRSLGFVYGGGREGVFEKAASRAGCLRGRSWRRRKGWKFYTVSRCGGVGGTSMPRKRSEWLKTAHYGLLFLSRSSGAILHRRSRRH